MRIVSRAKHLLLVVSCALSTSGVSAQSPEDAARIGKPLPAWREGELDIHHVNTGRGEASFLIFPDGTNLLIDTSGKTVEKPPFSLPTKPDATRPPGEWVARYIRDMLPVQARRIDYALLTHFHGDHMGAIVADSPPARQGGYALSGITEIAEHVPIARIIDRGWPDYDYPAPLQGATMTNYRKFLAWQIKNRNLAVEGFRPGRSDQIRLLRAAGRYPHFQVRNIYGGGVIWTGVADETRALVPPLASLAPADHPIENNLSLVLRISYGKFDYFTGGDLSAPNDELLAPVNAWKAVERPVAQVTGPVDAMKANHHGSSDANSAHLLGNLRPRVIVVGTRADGHPSVTTYARMTSQATWPGSRDIFITNVSPATFRTTYGIEKAASTQGHVVIRVARGGATYRVLVLDDSDELRRVKAIFGPYASR